METLQSIFDNGGSLIITIAIIGLLISWNIPRCPKCNSIKLSKYTEHMSERSTYICNKCKHIFRTW